MLTELARILRSLYRRITDPAEHQMSLRLMAWYYLMKIRRRLSCRKSAIRIPFATRSSVAGTKRIAVIVHCYYPELLGEILDHVAHIPSPHALYISTDTVAKEALIAETLRARNLRNYEIRPTTNRGRDLGPKYITFKDVYATCDYFVHLHTKKSPQEARAWGESWRKYLLNGLVGSPEMVQSVLAILSDPRVGLVFPYPYPLMVPELRWDNNYEMSAALAERLGIKVAKEYCPEYPAGSMHWGKPEAIQPLLDLDLTFKDFPAEPSRLDGEFHHALERLIVPIAQKQGLHGICTAAQRWWALNKSIRIESEEQLAVAISRCIESERLEAFSANR